MYLGYDGLWGNSLSLWCGLRTLLAWLRWKWERKWSHICWWLAGLQSLLGRLWWWWEVA